MLMSIPCGICHQRPCLHSEPQLTPTSPGYPLRPAGRSNSGFYGVTALSWVPVHMKPCVSPPRVESVSPISTELLHLRAPALLHSKPNALGAPPPNARPLGWEPDVGLKTHSCGKIYLFSNMIIFQFVGCPPDGYGIWLYHINTLSILSLWLLCLWV